MSNKLCEYCGKQQSIIYGSGRFCSQKCSRAFASINSKNCTKISNCLKCGKEITVKLRSGKQLCEQCKTMKHKRERICQNCGKQFTSYSLRNRDIRFCSITCVNNYRGNIAWDRQHRSVTLQSMRNSFAQGNRPCRGGRTKRYKVETLNGIITVQGTFQVRTCKILDKWLELNQILRWEYTKDRIKYKWQDGSEHLYFPDFKVTKLDNSSYYLQIKGFQKQLDTLKWQQTIQQGFQLKVWFQKDINEQQKFYFPVAQMDRALVS